MKNRTLEQQRFQGTWNSSRWLYRIFGVAYGKASVQFDGKENNISIEIKYEGLYRKDEKIFIKTTYKEEVWGQEHHRMGRWETPEILLSGKTTIKFEGTFDYEDLKSNKVVGITGTYKTTNPGDEGTLSLCVDGFGLCCGLRQRKT
jgi:hypothetical protein